jgi:hypothetical protein
MGVCLNILIIGSAPAYEDHPNVIVEPYSTLINETIKVNAGQYVHYKLQLTEGITLHAKFRVSGGSNNKADVWLLDMANYQLFSNNQPFSYYRGTALEVRGAGGYAFNIPQTNVYELVVDNRAAVRYSRNVYLYVYAVFPQEDPDSEEIGKGLQEAYDGLKKAFIFKDFKIILRHCGFENAFSDPDITICAELIDSLSANNLENAFLFIFLHELGHTLLREWDMPLWDNEDAQDEFATVLCLLEKATEYPLAAAQMWANASSKDEALSKLFIDDRHTISPQRARNIIHWINEPHELLRRWQKMLIPNMQTEALKAFDLENETWINHELIRAELKRR